MNYTLGLLTFGRSQLFPTIAVAVPQWNFPMNRCTRAVMAAMLLSLPCSSLLSSPAISQETSPTQGAKASPVDDWRDQSLPLFDGESLAGWEGNAYWFRIENDPVGGNAIVAGRLDERIPHNEFLCTTQNYQDFELRYDVKLVGDGDNAGVQFRSKRVNDSTEVSGYQADVGQAWDRPVWGALYDESRRNKMLAEGDAAAITKSVKPDDWNSFRVVCRGKHIEIFLNDAKTVDYTETDDSIPTYGVIGLQIHAGPPTEAWYRNIRVRQF